MTDHEFDRALVRGAFSVAAEHGWSRVSVAEAARRENLPLDRARARFPMRAAILLRFGSLADQAALAGAPADGPVRDRLFDMLMRRIDALQSNRDGILTLFRYLPTNPCAAALLAVANLRSMAWMLEAAGVAATGPRGRLRAKGLLAVWLAAARAWRGDTSEDLSATMAALDRALRRAEQVEGWLSGRRPEAGAPVADPAPSPAGEPAPAPDAEPSGETAPPPD
jgi:hypothetical protein